MEYPKDPPLRDKNYLLWLRKQPSEARQGWGDVVAHHLKLFKSGGTGKKPPDNHCLPVYKSVHDDIHNYGEKRVLLWQHGYTKIELKGIVEGLYRKYLKQKGGS